VGQDGYRHHEGPSPDQIAARTRWFDQYVEALNARSIISEPGTGTHACPCYQELTLDGRRQFEICPVCGSEDDGQDDQDADTVRGGPNSSISLTEA
jgi:hypothetical protein